MGAGGYHKQQHNGEELTARQKDWIGKLRSAATRHPDNRRAAAKYLKVCDDTLLSWVKFFTGKRDWPAVIPPRFDKMKVRTPTSAYRRFVWGQKEFATPEECTVLKEHAQRWMDKMGGTLTALANAAYIPEAQFRALFENEAVSAFAAKAMLRAFKGDRIWTPRRLSDAELEQRKQAVEDERAERERRLLEEERVRYGLTRQFRPLSRMIV
jgi:hypothetical protein